MKRQPQSRCRKTRLSSGGWVALQLTRVDIGSLSADDLFFIARILDTITGYERSQLERRQRHIELRAELDRWADDGGHA